MAGVAMKEVMKKVARSLGMEAQAHSAWRTMKAHGMTPWEPLVPEDAFSRCVRQAFVKLCEREYPSELGDYLEFGVARGSSMACVHSVMKAVRADRARLIGFDSFRGLPDEAGEEGWVPGEFRSSLMATRRYLASRNVNMERVQLVPGWFRDTLTPMTRADLRLDRASLILIDCDIFSASRDALAFCAAHIQGQAVIMLDDWGAAEERGVMGQREAFEEFLAANPQLQASEMESYSDSARIFHLQGSGAPVVDALQLAHASEPTQLIMDLSGNAWPHHKNT